MFPVTMWTPFYAFPQKGQGAPAREPLVTDDQQKQMMMHYYRRQEELKVREAHLTDGGIKNHPPFALSATP